MSKRSSPPSWYEPTFLFSSFSGISLFTPVLVFSLGSSSGSSLCSCYPCTLLTLFFIHLTLQGSPNSHPSEELLKQPDYSDKIKQMLGNHQGQSWSLGEEAYCRVEGEQGAGFTDSGEQGYYCWWGGQDWTEHCFAKLV